MRPYETSGKPVPDNAGLLVVRSTLTLANGTRYPGYVYYAPELPPEAGPGYGRLANLQPSIITPAGQVMFWYGGFAPTREVMDEAYRLLGAGATGAFPVRFASDVPLATGPISGEMAGFYYLVDKRKGWLSKERVVETTS